MLAELGCVVLVTALLTGLTFRKRLRTPRIPFAYDGDALVHGAWIKNMIQTGWVNHNPKLGAPFEQVYYDFPLGGDNFHFLLLRIGTLLSGDWALVMNMFFVASFAAAAMTAHLCLRWLGASRWLAGAAAVLFAFAPLHFFRGPAHLFLASYAIVPVGVLLAVRAASGTLPWTPTTPNAHRGRAIARSWPWFAGLAAVGASGAYYFIFAVLVIVTAAAFMALVSHTIRPLLAAAASIAVAGTSFAIGLAPSWWYWRSNGRVDVAQRAMFEQDLYGLRIVSLLSPVRYHLIEPLHLVAGRLANPGSSAESSQYLGMVAAIGLVVMIVTLLRNAIAGHRTPDQLRGLFSVLVVVCISVSAIGGLSWLGGLVSFTSIRSWARISPFISFLVLAWVATGLAGLELRVATGDRARRAVGAVALVAVTVFGVIDQTPRVRLPAAPNNPATAWKSDSEYFAGVEQQLGAGAAVFELPVRRFPEVPPTVDSGPYDQLRPFLSTDTLCWSYGGMKYRQSEWQQQLIGRPTPQFLDDIIATGFTGLTIDRYGYVDRGKSLEADITAIVGSEPLRDSTGRWATYALAEFAAKRTSQRSQAWMRDRAVALLGDDIDQVINCATGYTETASKPGS